MCDEEGSGCWGQTCIFTFFSSTFLLFHIRSPPSSLKLIIPFLLPPSITPSFFTLHHSFLLAFHELPPLLLSIIPFPRSPSPLSSSTVHPFSTSPPFIFLHTLHPLSLPRSSSLSSYVTTPPSFLYQHILHHLPSPSLPSPPSLSTTHSPHLPINVTSSKQ